MIGGGGNFSTVRAVMEKCQLIKSNNSIFEEFENLKIDVPLQAQTLPYMVLGRYSIFKRFIARFDENAEKKITLKRVQV